MPIRCKGCLTPFDPPEDETKFRCPACGVPHILERKSETKAPKISEMGFPEIEALPSVPDKTVMDLEKTALAPPRTGRLARKLGRLDPNAERHHRRRIQLQVFKLPEANARSFGLALLTVIILFLSWTSFHLFYRQPTMQVEFERNLLKAYEFYDLGQDAQARESLEKAIAIDPDSLLVQDLLKRLSEPDAARLGP